MNILKNLFSRKKINTYLNTQYQIQSLFTEIKNGDEISDGEFDKLYPPYFQEISSVQWSPIHICKLVLDLFNLKEEDQLLDVGSGVGKFCFIAAILTKANVTGVEKRKELVQVSNGILKQSKLKNLNFIHKRMEDLDWNQFSCLYFYNPFYENISPHHRIDDEIPEGIKKFSENLNVTKQKLSDLKKGTKIVTYHSFGGKMPSSYKKIKHINLTLGELESWIKI
ncbi:MAG: methyltransferase domain-containing protein [Leptospira sp.]|nr:methyltransferase domain-containing protein [Leptospira sp.]